MYLIIVYVFNDALDTLFFMAMLAYDIFLRCGALGEMWC